MNRAFITSKRPLYPDRKTTLLATAILLLALPTAPAPAATNTILDTTFITGEGYSDNTDLAGQDLWTATPVSSPAFMVTDAAGPGFADSAPYTNSFDSLFGNDVYYNHPMTNGTGDVWTGSVTFQVTAPATPGQAVVSTFDLFDETGTNVIGSFTGTNDVAGITGAELLKIGLTAAPTTGLNHSDSNDILFYVRTQASGRLDFNFNSAANTDRIFAVPRDVLGWDPNWLDTGNDATNGPDSVTDPITLNWLIRKTTVSSTFLADLEIVIGSTTNDPSWEGVKALPVTFDGSPDIYNAGLVYFGLGIDDEADFGKDSQGTGTEITASVRSVAVDSLRLVKADDQPPALQAPLGLAATVADASVALTWDAAVEATSYTVRRYSHMSGGTATVVTNGLADLTFTDTGLTNGWTYFYAVAADYGVAGEAESDRLAARPLAQFTLVQWGPSPDTVTANENWDATEATVGSIVNHVGSNPDGAMWIHGTGGSYDTNAAPPLYGVSQLGNGVWAQRQVRQESPDDLIRIRTKSGSGLTPNGFHSSLIWLESADFSGGAALDLTTGPHAYETLNNDWTAELEFGALRTAIRNGTQWYVGETIHTDTGATQVPDLATEKWTPLTPATLASTSIMTVSGATYNVVGGLTDVNAVGFFGDHVRSFYMVSFKVTTGDVATPLQLWADGFDLYNDDAAADLDYDGDFLSNVGEWGLGGDPTDPGNDGFSPVLTGPDATGSKVIYVYPRLMSEPRPTYWLEETADLTNPSSWSNQEGTYTITTGPRAGGNENFENVTNAIPSTVDAKFIRLRITE